LVFITGPIHIEICCTCGTKKKKCLDIEKHVFDIMAQINNQCKTFKFISPPYR